MRWLSVGGIGILLVACEPIPPVLDCDEVGERTDAILDAEEVALALVNEARAVGGSCGSRGDFPPSAPLAWNEALSCAAVVHSADMGVRGYFAHTSRASGTVGDRVDRAGYAWSRIGENIALGQSTAAIVVEAWLNSPAHCANLMEPNYTDSAVGLVMNANGVPYWTQVFGTPQR
jgi:uncharacterized protein YkwD